MAPGVGIEPTAKGLTVLCSTAELPRNKLIPGSVPPAEATAKVGATPKRGLVNKYENQRPQYNSQLKKERQEGII